MKVNPPNCALKSYHASETAAAASVTVCVIALLAEHLGIGELMFKC